jgi:hypothetical protein
MDQRNLRTALIGFAGGVLGTLLFHQVFLLVLHRLGLVPFAPYSTRPVPPFGVPQFISLAFWGGIWGVVLVFLMDRRRELDRLWFAVVFGGVMPTLVAALVVTPMKGGNMADWMDLGRLVLGFAINGFWGLGTALVYRLSRRAAKPVFSRGS